MKFSGSRACVFATFSLAFLCLAGCGRQDVAPSVDSGHPSRHSKRIGLVYTAPHTIINQTVDGFKAGVREDLRDFDVEIIEKHASGDWAQHGPAVDATIAQRIDVLVPITTPISQEALKRAPTSMPICFLDVTDPVGAGLVGSPGRARRCTGVSDLAPFKKNLEFIRNVLPKARTVAFPYNPEDQPGVFGLEQVKKLAPSYGLEISAKAVTSKDEIFLLACDLMRTSDCLLVGSDNLMFEASPTLVKAGMLVRKPVIGEDSTSIKNGAVGGYTIDYYQVGREGARIVGQILRGKAVETIPVVTLDQGVLELNLDAARQLQLEFPETLRKAAKVVYQGK